jgi:hypothetical protein
MSDQYSPERRTALVLTGTGADGAYHAGVLRALHDAGIKIDLVCGRGIGVVSAMFAAVDGGAKLWDPKGLWRAPAIERAYRWRWPIRVVFALLGALAGILISPLLFLLIAGLIYPVGLLLGMAGFDAGGTLARTYLVILATAFSPAALPTWLPRVVAAAVFLALVVLAIGTLIAWRRTPLRRRSRGPFLWAVVGTPLDVSVAAHHFIGGVWDLLKGGANLKMPSPPDLSRRFTELLTENLGQPGFSELLVTVHDIDARRDMVFGLVREPFRRALFPPPGVPGARRAEAFDLAGLAQDQLVHVLRAALSVPGVTDPVLVRFAPDTYWRGEVHRLADRPAAVARLLEEAAAAGAEQLILVSAAPDSPGPHKLERPRVDPLGRMSEHAVSMEAAAVRDAVSHVRHRFRALYEIRPMHNPVGAFDLRGAYDERSDREHSLSELMERGYEDAHRDFIEPVVAVSGENLQSATPETPDLLRG